MLSRSLSRIIISQDRHELFVTIGSYIGSYVQFVKGTQGKYPDYLQLQEYIPWKISSQNNMRHVALIMVAFCIAREDDREDREDPMEDV